MCRTFFLQLIDKLSVKTPSGEVKLKVMKEIAKEYQVEWDTTESEMELLKPPEELIVCFFLSYELLVNYGFPFNLATYEVWISLLFSNSLFLF